MTEPLTERTVVIGNSGSGKSTLAEAIASLAHIPAIDLDLLHWEEGCRAGLLARGPRRGATSDDTAELMKWAEAYWTRQTPSSFAGHSKMFNDFSGTKLRLKSREHVAQLLENIRTNNTSTDLQR